MSTLFVFGVEGVLRDIVYCSYESVGANGFGHLIGFVVRALTGSKGF